MHCHNASVILQGATEERRKGIYFPMEEIVKLNWKFDHYDYFQKILEAWWICHSGKGKEREFTDL